MALQWDITKCDPPEFVDEHERQGFFNSFIYMPMIVGIPNITESNWTEFYARVHALELLGGGFRNKVLKSGLKPIMYTKVEIKRWVGLETNASPITERKFLNKLRDTLHKFSE